MWQIPGRKGRASLAGEVVHTLLGAERELPSEELMRRTAREGEER